MKISVVVPVYNSAEVLPVLVERLETASRDLGLDLELLLVMEAAMPVGR